MSLSQSPFHHLALVLKCHILSTRLALHQRRSKLIRPHFVGFAIVILGVIANYVRKLAHFADAPT